MKANKKTFQLMERAQSCKGRATFNYFPGGLFARPDMFIG